VNDRADIVITDGPISDIYTIVMVIELERKHTFSGGLEQLLVDLVSSATERAFRTGMETESSPKTFRVVS
jgi:hypothetical protein